MNTINDLIKYDQIIHNWGRIIGDIGYRFIPKENDDSHANFKWNNKAQQLEGRPFNTPKGKLFISFNTKKNAFIIYEANSLKVKGTIAADQSHYNILKQIQNVLVDSGITLSKCPSVINYRYPEHFDENGYIMQPNDTVVNSWEQLRSGANIVLAEVFELLNINSDIRIWPSNFDTGIFYQHKNGLSQFAGFAPADQKVSETPYFYNSFYKDNQSVVPKVQTKLNHGYWEIQKWHGAVYPLTTIENIDDFLKSATQFLIDSTKNIIDNQE